MRAVNFIVSIMSNELLDAGPSVPKDTGIPLESILETGLKPLFNLKFDIGL